MLAARVVELPVLGVRATLGALVVICGDSRSVVVGWPDGIVVFVGRSGAAVGRSTVGLATPNERALSEALVGAVFALVSVTGAVVLLASRRMVDE